MARGVATNDCVTAARMIRPGPNLTAAVNTAEPVAHAASACGCSIRTGARPDGPFTQHRRTRCGGSRRMQCVESRCPCSRHSAAQSILGRLGHAAGRGCRDKMAGLRKEIAAVRLHRGAHRKRRRSNNTPVVALVGYTNAGKSTLLNRLTAAGVLQEDALFATLDPTTRRLMLPSGKRALLTDTVGFIQKLPTQLIAAFRATLEEVEARAPPCSVAPAANSRQEHTTRRSAAGSSLG